jgi:hypothetical protein
MGLLTFVMGISMNVLSIVLEMTNDAEYSIVVTQESSYATENVKRIVRSAEDFKISDDGLELIVSYLGENIIFRFEEFGTDTGNFVLKRETVSNKQSIMSSEVLIKKINDVPFFSLIIENGSTIGVKMSFKIFHINDESMSSSTIIYTQAIARNIILNK